MLTLESPDAGKGTGQDLTANTARDADPVIAGEETLRDIFSALCERRAGVRLLMDENITVLHGNFIQMHASESAVLVAASQAPGMPAADGQALNMAFSDGIKNYLAQTTLLQSEQNDAALHWHFQLPDKLLMSEFRRYLRIYVTDSRSTVRILDQQLREFRCQLRDFSERGFRLVAGVREESHFFEMMDQHCVADLMIKDGQSFQVSARLRNKVHRGQNLELGFEIVDLPEAQANRLRKLVMAESAHKPHLR
ncbi:PilZ domain-containing protein [Undibacterium squillarum]|uniref:PilZ domain-containing protein n=1 Tax=Undibacterium squillarum TaxID=1131567 RepID=A0ABQ2XS64_9BURK|nr:PilZ domain-containing protein [Undibacterium squillarum]GGX31018.1 hypothetical protein GCM10010946_05130 [Undibacterium squillarum]